MLIGSFVHLVNFVHKLGGKKICLKHKLLPVTDFSS